MIEIGFSSSFKRAYKKTIKGKTELEQKFWQRIEIFKANPFDERLKTPKLSGKLKDLWSFSTNLYGYIVISGIVKILAPDARRAPVAEILTHYFL